MLSSLMAVLVEGVEKLFVGGHQGFATGFGSRGQGVWPDSQCE